MKKQLRKAITVLLAVIFVCSSALLGWHLYQNKQAEELYQRVSELAGLPQENVLEALKELDLREDHKPTQSAYEGLDAAYSRILQNVDLGGLYSENNDLIGWILLPGTRISYPLMQRDNNEYYLNHGWDHSWNTAGAIFLDYRNSGDLSDFNTVIYGHRMDNRSMFGELHNYKKEGYWETHPSIFIRDGNGCYRYDIFAAYETGTNNTYSRQITDHDDRSQWITECLQQSVIDTGIQPTTSDRFITLSTCTGTGHSTRWVVQAVWRGTSTH